MPKGYLEMKAAFCREGMSLKAAEKKAARIWNANPNHKGNTVGRGRK